MPILALIAYPEASATCPGAVCKIKVFAGFASALAQSRSG